MAHAVDRFVDRGILFDIRVRSGHVGFRLVIIVVRNKILHRVVGKKPLHLGIELGRQRLVRRQHQSRALDRLDHFGHGESLARAGHAEQHLVALGGLDPRQQRLYGRGLVARRRVVRDHAQRLGKLARRRLFRDEGNRRGALRGEGHEPLYGPSGAAQNPIRWRPAPAAPAPAPPVRPAGPRAGGRALPAARPPRWPARRDAHHRSLSRWRSG